MRRPLAAHPHYSITRKYSPPLPTPQLSPPPPGVSVHDYLYLKTKETHTLYGNRKIWETLQNSNKALHFAALVGFLFSVKSPAPCSNKASLLMKPH